MVIPAVTMVIPDKDMLTLVLDSESRSCMDGAQLDSTPVVPAPVSALRTTTTGEGRLRLIMAETLAARMAPAGAEPVFAGKSEPHRYDADTMADPRAGHATRNRSDAKPSPDWNEMLLEVEINSARMVGVRFYLQDEAGRVYAPEEDFARWRLIPPDIDAVSYRNRRYLPLDAVADLSYTVDAARQVLVIEAPAAAFARTTVTPPLPERVPVTKAPPGAFLNYDALFEHQDIDRGTIASGAFELGAFNDWGLATTTFLAQGLDREARVVRLNSTLTRDWPEDMRTLRLGDSISQPGAWGRSVQFGGVQLGTNFATRPDFISFPLPDLAGEAALPATVELYADDVLRLRREIEPGPFDVIDMPLTTGARDIQLVVRDVLGREQIISAPYYISRDVLREGLHDFSYEAGVVRQRFSLASHDYGRFFGAATHRYGFSDRITGEARVELLRDQQTVGLSTSVLASRWLGTLFASAAGSSSDAGSGALLAAGLDRLGRRVSYGFQATWTSEDFRQLGLQPSQPAPRWNAIARLGLSLPDYGSLSLSYIHLDRRIGADARFINVNYGFRPFGRAFLNLFINHDLERDDPQFGISLTHALGRGVSASVRHRQDRDAGHSALTVQRNLPFGTGVGYQLLAEEGHTDRYLASVTAATEMGIYGAEAARFGDVNALRLNAAGGVALLNGSGYLSRPLQDSFGVVQTADYENVRVYHENHEIGRTGADGTVLVPRMRSFQANRLRIEQADLPLDARIDRLEKTVAPGFRRGIHVPFPVQPARGALIEILLEDGTPLPASAEVRIVDDEETFPAGRRGEVYVTGLAATNQLIAEWNERRCRFEVVYPEVDDPLPRIGPIVCHEAD